MTQEKAKSVQVIGQKKSELITSRKAVLPTTA